MGGSVDLAHASTSWSVPPRIRCSGESDLMGGVELHHPSILDDQRDRAVSYSQQQAFELRHEGAQILRFGRVETGQGTPPGRPRPPEIRVIEEFDRLSRK